MKPSADTLQVDITYIKQALGEIKNDIKEMKTQYATKAELADVKDELDKKIEPMAKVFSTVSAAILLIALGAFVYLVATHPLSLLAK